MKVLLLHAFVSLLAASFALAEETPSDEFKNQPRQTFSSRDNPKSNGFDLSIQYPKSWKAREGQRPHVLTLIQSQKGDVNLTLLVNPIPLPEGQSLSDEDVSEMLSESTLKENVPKGGKFLYYNKTKMDNQPAAVFAWIAPQERAGVTVISYSQNYVVYYKNSLILLLFTTGVLPADDASEILQKKVKLYSPLFTLLANSFIIHEQY